MTVDKQIIENLDHDIENLNYHRPVNISKHGRLGRVFRLKNSVKICLACEEEWPCALYESRVEKVLQRIRELRQLYEITLNSFNEVVAMQSESLFRIALARDALEGTKKTTVVQETTIEE